MILDEHTPCPVCPQLVRDLYVAARRVLAHERRLATAEHEELHLHLEAMRAWVEAHHANQLHSHSTELEDARHPTLESQESATVLPFDPGGSQR